MSLINEALKKAQEQEHGRNAPASRVPAAAVRRGGPPSLILGVVSVLVAGGVGAWFLFGGETKPETPVVAGASKSPAVAEASVKAVAVPKVPVESATGETPKVVEPVKAPAVETTPAPVEPAKPVAPKVVVPEAPKEDEAVRELINAMTVSLARKATQRCVINGKVYQVGDQVHATPQVLLEKVEDTTLTLVDANAVRYIKKFK